MKNSKNIIEDSEITTMLDQNAEQIKKLHKIVRKTMEEEKLIVDNLLHPPKETLTSGQRVSDKVARFGGSWKFIILFTVLLIVWIIYNTSLPAADRFDPYPFILMNLVLSCIAALQAPVIMMSQNRQEEKDRMRGENDYLVNLKSELEIKSLHKKIDMLQEEQIKVLYDAQATQLRLLKELSQKIEGLEKYK